MASTSVARAGRGILKVLLLLVCLAGTAWAQRGAITIPANLDQLTKRADIIVRGTVATARVEKHPDLGIYTIVVTLRVSKVLKGEAGEALTFRQYIWDIRDRHDAAGYRKGQEVLLMLLAPNEHGLWGLAGMEQGRFRIFRDRSGKDLAVNGVGNFLLFRGMQEKLQQKSASLSPATQKMLQWNRAAPIAASDLEQLIRSATEGAN